MTSSKSADALEIKDDELEEYQIHDIREEIERLVFFVHVYFGQGGIRFKFFLNIDLSNWTKYLKNHHCDVMKIKNYPSLF